jgi:hypothetical protein
MAHTPLCIPRDCYTTTAARGEAAGTNNGDVAARPGRMPLTMPIVDLQYTRRSALYAEAPPVVPMPGGRHGQVRFG